MTIPQKIVFVGLTDYTNAPTRVRCYNFAEELARLGWETDVFSFQSALAPEHLKNKEMAAMLNVPEEVKLNMVKRSVPLLEKTGPAIFYLQKNHYHAASVYYVCKKHNWPYILDYDDDDRTRSSLLSSTETSMKYFDTVGDIEILKTVASEAACCVASSANIRNFLSVWNPKTFLIETGADLNKFTYFDRTSSDSANVVWLGQLWGQPILESLDIACRAVQQVHRKGIPCKLQIYARGMETALPDYLDFNYPNVPISFNGWVPPDKVNNVLKNMDIAVFPQRPARQDYEWMSSKSPTKLFEYMASGLPVAATAIGDARRIITSGHDSLLSDSATEMADHIAFLASNKTARLEMGRNAYSTVSENYSLKRLGAKLSDTLKGAFNGL